MPELIKRNRRDFLKSGMTGLAGVFAASSAVDLRASEKAAAAAVGPTAAGDGDILRRSLGKSGLNVAVLGMGCGYITDSALVKASLDAGVNYIDTAYAYMNGRADEAIGKIIKDVKRDSIVVGTKADMPQVNQTGLYKRDIKAEEFIRRVEKSLKRMGLEYADIVFIHDLVREEDVTFEPLLSALEKLKRDGKTRAIGVAFHRNEPAILEAMTACGRYDAAVVSYNFRQPHVKQVQAAIAKARAAGIGIVAMKPMAGVYWDSKRTEPINGRAATKWPLMDENVSVVIPGYTTFDQLTEDIPILRDVRLTDEERAALRLDKEPQPDGLYCAQCGNCLKQCPARIDIPTLMRAYMYAYGYKNAALAHSVAANAGGSESSCRKCAVCAVNCTMGFRVNERLTEITQLASLPAGILG